MRKPTRFGCGTSCTFIYFRDIGLNLLQVFLTTTHLAIVMEYAAGGELFDRIVRAGRFSEDEARFFFQQLVAGVDYCHSEVSRGQHMQETPGFEHQQALQMWHS